MDAAIKAGSDGTRQQRRLLGLSAFDRHQALIKDAIHYYRAKLPPEQQTVKTDYDVLKEQYRYSPKDTCWSSIWHGNFQRHLSTACAVWCQTVVFTHSAGSMQRNSTNLSQYSCFTLCEPTLHLDNLLRCAFAIIECVLTEPSDCKACSANVYCIM